MFNLKSQPGQRTQTATSITADCSYYFYEGEDLIGQQDRGALAQPEESYAPKFLLLDHLGTTRAELTFPGGVPTVAQVYDTMPYGELIDAPAPDEQVIFTGKPRDGETGLDIFGPRNYGFNLCRWLSPDIAMSNRPTNPSSWNMFMYCSNSPVNRIDSNGMEDGFFTRGLKTLATVCVNIIPSCNDPFKVVKTAWKNSDVKVSVGGQVDAAAATVNLYSSEVSTTTGEVRSTFELGAGFGVKLSWPTKTTTTTGNIHAGKEDAFGRPAPAKEGDIQLTVTDFSKSPELELSAVVGELSYDFEKSVPAVNLTIGGALLFGVELELCVNTFLRDVATPAPPATSGTQSSSAPPSNQSH